MFSHFDHYKNKTLMSGNISSNHIILAYLILLCVNITGINTPAIAQELTNFTEYEQSEPIVSVNVKDEDIVNVLKDIAEQCKFNIVISKNISGTVTVKLQDVPINQALDAVLSTNNYMYSINGDIINVFTYQEMQQGERFIGRVTEVFSLKHADPLDIKRALLSMKSERGNVELDLRTNQIIVTDTPKKVSEIKLAIEKLDIRLETRKYKLKYANPIDIRNKLLQLIPPEKGDVFVDERTNSVIIRAVPAVLDGLDNLIEGWDVQHRQVLIEAKILQVTLDDQSGFGITWPRSLGINFQYTGTYQKGFSSVATLTSDAYRATLELLESTADTTVLSAPRIVVLNNKEAQMLVGSNEPYTVLIKDVDTGLVTTETKYQEVGVKLIVAPTIGEDNYITMKIHPEVSSARRVPEAENALAIDTSEADTTMMVKNGETIVLGGLIKDEDITTSYNVPIIGKIPIIGGLFRSSGKEKVKRELLVFITPSILTDENRQNISLDNVVGASERVDMDIEEIIDFPNAEEEMIILDDVIVFEDGS